MAFMQKVVTFETAQIINEKDVDIGAKWFYNKDTKEIRVSTPDNQIGYSPDWIAAHHQSTLQEWLARECGIILYVRSIDGMKTERGNFQYVIEDSDITSPASVKKNGYAVTESGYDEYENAVEAGIQEAFRTFVHTGDKMVDGEPERTSEDNTLTKDEIKDRLDGLINELNKKQRKLELSANPDDWILVNSIENVIIGIEQSKTKLTRDE